MRSRKRSPQRRKLAHLEHAFDFTQAPISPTLPTAKQLYASASQTVLTLNAGATVPACATGVPAWLPGLLGV